MLQFADPRSHRADPYITIGINLPEAFEFGFRSNQLALQGRSRLDHSLSLFFDVDCRISAGELAELLLCRFEVFTDGLQTLFKKDAFAASRRGAKFRYQTVQLFNICLIHGRGAPRVVVGHTDHDDLALPVYGY